MNSTLKDFVIECFEAYAYAQLAKYSYMEQVQVYMHACFVTVARLLY